MKFKISISLILSSFIIFYLYFMVGSLSSAVFYIIISVIILATFSDLKFDGLFLFIVGIMFVVFFYYYWLYKFGIAYYMGNYSDDWMYETQLSQLYFSKYGINPMYLTECFPLHNSPGYIYVVVLLRKFGENFDGYHTFLPRFFNIYFLTLVSLFCYKIAKYYQYSVRTCKKCFYGVFLLPVMLFSSVHVFRDTFVSILMLIFFYSCLVFSKNRWHIVPVLLCMLIIATLRSANFLLLLCGFPLFAIKRKILNIYTISFFLLIIFFLYIYYYDSILLNLDILNTYNALNGERFGELGNKIFSLPKTIGWIPRMVFLIFSPVPNWVNFFQMYVSINAFIQIIFFPFLVLSLLDNKIDVRLKVFFLMSFMLIAMTTATFRHVLMYMPLGVLLVCFEIENRGMLSFKRYFEIISLLGVTFVGSIGLALYY